MIQAFEDLGKLTAAKWTALGAREEAFPEAATAALNESGVLNTMQLSEIIEWLPATRDLPEQYAKEFGQPPVNVYVADKFFIQVLFWIDATTAIHEHGFSGAFGVLAGSSVHSQYRFSLTSSLAKELQLGNVEYASSELLRKGDLRTIHFGGTFIHALFHLERPSVSLVVRTKFVPDCVQYTYLPPHVAIDPFFSDKNLSVKFRLLESLRAVRSEHFWKCAESLISRAEPWMSFNSLISAYKASRAEVPEWQALLEKAKAVWGPEIIECMVASIKTDERSNKLSRLRSVVYNPTYRFFLALLLNVPSRDTLLKLVAQQCGSERPASLVMQWIREMSAAGMFLSKFEPDLLDVIELALLHNSFSSARSAVASNDAYSGLTDEARMAKLWNDARASSFFQPLFEGVEGPPGERPIATAA